jgi:hypothetical protein
VDVNELTDRVAAAGAPAGAWPDLLERFNLLFEGAPDPRHVVDDVAQLGAAHGGESLRADATAWLEQRGIPVLETAPPGTGTAFRGHGPSMRYAVPCGTGRVAVDASEGRVELWDSPSLVPFGVIRTGVAGLAGTRGGGLVTWWWRHIATVDPQTGAHIADGAKRNYTTDVIGVPDGRLVSRNIGGDVDTWSADVRWLRTLYGCEGPDGDICREVVLVGGDTVGCLTRGGWVHVIALDGAVVAELGGPSDPMVGIAAGPDGPLVAWSARTIVGWSRGAVTRWRVPPPVPEGGVLCLSEAAAVRWCGAEPVTIINPATGRQVARLEPPTHAVDWVYPVGSDAFAVLDEAGRVDVVGIDQRRRATCRALAAASGVVALADRSVVVWDGSFVHRHAPDEDDGPPFTGAAGIDGQSFTAWTDDEVRIWRAGRWVSRHPLVGDRPVVLAAHGRVTIASGGRVRISDAETARELGHIDTVALALIALDDRRVVAWDGTDARVWDASGGTATAPLARAVVLDDDVPVVWDAEGRPLPTAPVAAGVVALSDGRLAVARSGMVRVTDRYGALVWEAPADALITPVASARRTDAGEVVVACVGAQLRAYDAASGREVATPGGHDDVYALAALGPTVATWGPGDCILWDIGAERRVTRLFHAVWPPFLHRLHGGRLVVGFAGAQPVIARGT